jgi:small subunit ribosomal protein S19
MSRSLKKGPYIDENLLKKVQIAQRDNTNNAIKTWARSSVISPEFVGIKLAVHNGKDHITYLVTEDMVGHRLGEFAPSRKFRKHGGRIAREQEAAATTPTSTAAPAKENK